MDHVSETVQDLLETLRQNRDNEVSMAAEVLPQYITDHNDKDAYREVDRQVNRLARQWDAMIRLLERTLPKIEKIEQGCENFYGD